MSDYWEEDEEQETAEEEVRPRPIRRRRTRNNEQRGNLYLLTGLVIGVALGLVYAWLISPVQYVDNVPSSLATPYKDEYRRLIALAYSANHNLSRARERLALLDTGNPVQVLASQAQRMLAENQPPQEARALALLAADLSKPGGSTSGGTPSPQVVSGDNSELTPTTETGIQASSTPDVSSAIQTPTLPLPTLTPTITHTPLPTFTLRPTATAARILDAPFTLKSKKEVCGTTAQPGLIQLQVTGADGKPLPGVQILVTWQSGEDTFFTGLAPDISPGYADYTMSPGITYNLKVGEASKVVNGVTVPACGGGWKMEFVEGKR
jgi:hypothetical protein